MFRDIYYYSKAQKALYGWLWFVGIHKRKPDMIAYRKVMYSWNRDNQY